MQNILFTSYFIKECYVVKPLEKRPDNPTMMSLIINQLPAAAYKYIWYITSFGVTWDRLIAPQTWVILCAS